MSKNKKINVIPGEGNIKISKVEEHLEIEKPEDENIDKNKIIIPEKKDSF